MQGHKFLGEELPSILLQDVPTQSLLLVRNT